MRSHAVVAVLAALGIAACGGSSGTPASNTSSSTSSSSAVSGQVLQTISISATDYKLAPAAINLAKAGTYDFKLTDNGTVQHALEVEGNGVEAKTNVLSPGASADLKVALKAGTYQMYCPVDGHKGFGMLGKITVTG